MAGGRAKFRRQMAGYLLYWEFIKRRVRERGFERDSTWAFDRRVRGRGVTSGSGTRTRPSYTGSTFSEPVGDAGPQRRKSHGTSSPSGWRRCLPWHSRAARATHRPEHPVNGGRRRRGPVRVLYCEGNTDGTIGGSYYSLLFLIEGLKGTRYESVAVFHREHRLLPGFAPRARSTRNPEARPRATREVPPTVLVRLAQRALNLGRFWRRLAITTLPETEARRTRALEQLGHAESRVDARGPLGQDSMHRARARDQRSLLPAHSSTRPAAVGGHLHLRGRRRNLVGARRYAWQPTASSTTGWTRGIVPSSPRRRPARRSASTESAGGHRPRLATSRSGRGRRC